jgi:hypothetical protein
MLKLAALKPMLETVGAIFAWYAITGLVFSTTTYPDLNAPTAISVTDIQLHCKCQLDLIFYRYLETLLSDPPWRLPRSQDSVVGIATGYGLDDWGIGVWEPVGSRIFSSPRRPDRLWGPFNFLSNEYQEFLPTSNAAEAWSGPLTSS